MSNIFGPTTLIGVMLAIGSFSTNVRAQTLEELSSHLKANEIQVEGDDGRSIHITETFVEVDEEHDPRKVIVFLPNSVEEMEKERQQGIPHNYIVFFHGYGYGSPTLDRDADGDFENNYVDILSKTLLEMGRDWIVLMPDGGSCMNGTFFIDSNYNGPIGRWSAKDVPEKLGAVLPLQLDNGDGAALIGHSMGGYAALRLSQLYPQDYKIVVAHNPLTSFMRTVGLILEMNEESDNGDGTFTYDFRGVPEYTVQDGEYEWDKYPDTDVFWSLSAAMDSRSHSTSADGTCTPADPGVFFAVNETGLIKPSSFLHWYAQDVIFNFNQNPWVWQDTALYFDGPAIGYTDEYHLQHNSRALDIALQSENNTTAGSVQYRYEPYPEAGDSSVEPSSEVHFLNLSKRILRGFKFVADEMYGS